MLCLCFPDILVHVPTAVSKYPTEATVLTQSEGCSLSLGGGVAAEGRSQLSHTEPSQEER